MQFQWIKITNFLSIKDIELKFNTNNGIILIEGKNQDTGSSNGSGKSALLESIYWGLTGKTLRKSTEETLINTDAKKGLEVIIKAKEFVITRSRKPTHLKFVTNDKDLTKASVIETQVEIDKFLNTNYKLLQASMFLGQHSDLTFLESSADEKRTIIRNFLNLEDLFSKRDKIKDLKSDFLTESKSIEAAVKQNNLLVENNNKKLDEIEKNKSYLDEFKDVEITLEEILALEEFNRDLVTWEKNTIRSIEQQTSELQLLEEQLKNSKIGDRIVIKDCSKCGTVLEERIVTQENISYLNLLISEKKYKLIEIVVDKANLQYRKVPIKSSDFTRYTEYKKLVSSSEIFKETNIQLENQIRDLDLKRQNVLKMYDVMKFWEKAFSEHGIIKYIIRNILTYFNTRCNYYLSLLTSNKYFILFDEELEEKISTNGIFIHYISLSGGEKRKVNLAVLLGLKDLLTITNKTPFNTLFFDEITDFIDDEGMGNVVQLLNELKKDKLIFLITHNKHLRDLLDSSKKIVVHKKDNRSYLAR